MNLKWDMGALLFYHNTILHFVVCTASSEELRSTMTLTDKHRKSIGNWH